MRTGRILVAMAIAGGGLAGCASSDGSGESWSRSYMAPLDRVLDTVTDVLEDDEYLVEVDRETGRVAATPSRSNRGGSPSLSVRVVEKAGRVSVDVQTRAGFDDASTRGSRIDAWIVEFFHELELRLQGFKE